MKSNSVYSVSNAIVFREEDDDWAILVNQDTAETYSLNPVGVMVYKQINGANCASDIVEFLIGQFRNPPQDADLLIYSFLELLSNNSIISCTSKGNSD